MKTIRHALASILICVSMIFLLIGAGFGTLAGFVHGED